MPDGTALRNSAWAIDHCKPLLGGCWIELQGRREQGGVLYFDLEVGRLVERLRERLNDSRAAGLRVVDRLGQAAEDSGDLLLKTLAKLFAIF